MLSKHPITALKGVGAKQAERLNKLKIFTAQDLLFHLPIRYQDKTRVLALESTLLGKEVQVEVEITGQHLTRSRNASLVVNSVDIHPEGNAQLLSLRFFHFHHRQAQQLKNGLRVRAFGELRRGFNGLEIVHPEYILFDDIAPKLEPSLRPVYPLTEGIGQATLLKLVKQTLSLLRQYPLDEVLPIEVVQELNFSDINQALLTLHSPSPDDDLQLMKQFKHLAQQRLVFEELLAHQLSLQKARKTVRAKPAPAMREGNLTNSLISSLPFTLTQPQQIAWEQIHNDLTKSRPMQRLLQGEVGSGKTIVAILAAVQVAESGYQVAIMAPTEILAEQHQHHFLEWMNSLGIEMAWINGSMKASDKKQMLGKIASGQAQVIIGTHALFQQTVKFSNLGLIIIDEQHRFGVHQRLELQNKGVTKNNSIHQLVMTATPIPRTLVMTVYGDLDISIINSLPPGRHPVKTVVMSNQKRFEVMSNLYQQCKKGVQAYWICPLIQESELLVAQAAEVVEQQFKQHWQDLKVGLIHGRMKTVDKSKIMQDFHDNKINLLVATTVIEVGVNVPNASLMIIENAERLGLAQLHQLRGRVGRGTKKSHCVLLYQHPLSKTSKFRLQTIKKYNDGFKIAQEDLKIRGSGEVLGTRQTGGLQFRIADLQLHSDLVDKAQIWSEKLINTNVEIVEKLQDRWIGKSVEYQNA